MCEHVHKTSAERLKPYVNNRCNDWIDMLSIIIFLLISRHIQLQGTPLTKLRMFTVLFSHLQADFDSIPADARSYVPQHREKFNVICTEMRNNVNKAQQSMLDCGNENINPLHVSQGDYVYLFTEVTGQDKLSKTSVLVFL